MGGRGREAMVMVSGIASIDPRTGEAVMQKGMWRQVTPWVELTPAQRERMISHTEAVDAVKSGLAKSGIQGLSEAEARSLTDALVVTGALFGGGSLRTRLYRAGRFLGDVGSVRGGSPRVYRRIMRRISGKVSGRVFRKVFGDRKRK